LNCPIDLAPPNSCKIKEGAKWHLHGGPQLQKTTSFVQECHRYAADVHSVAASAADEKTKADFLKIEQRWLLIADAYEKTGGAPLSGDKRSWL
jgi:hypothetical protein